MTAFRPPGELGLDQFEMRLIILLKEKREGTSEGHFKHCVGAQLDFPVVCCDIGMYPVGL